MAARLYDPLKMHVSFKGNQITDFAPGTFLEVSYNKDEFNLQVGSGGRGVVTRNPDRSGRVTLTLDPRSPQNELLNGYATANRLGTAGFGELFVKDTIGTTQVMAARAWIVKKPDLSFGGESQAPNKWVFESDNLDETVGSGPEA